MMVGRLARLVAVAVIAGSAPASAQLVLEPKQVLVSESIAQKGDKLAGGTIQPLEPEEFFAAIQLIHSDEPRLFDPGNMLHAPLWLPDLEAGQEARVCARFRSVNGVYEALVVHPVAGPTKEMGPYKYNSKYDPKKDGAFGTEALFTTAQLKRNCTTDASEVYVPLALDEDPDTLQVVVSVGNAVIKPLIGPWDGSGTPVEIPCERTSKLEDGFDCRLDLASAGLKPGPHALSVQVDLPGAEDPVLTAIVALP